MEAARCHPYHAAEESLQVVNQLSLLVTASVLVLVHLSLSQLVHDIGKLQIDAVDAIIGTLHVSFQ